MYGLKGVVLAWSSALIELMRDLGFSPFRADGDVWMRKSVETSNLGVMAEYGSPDG